MGVNGTVSDISHTRHKGPIIIRTTTGKVIAPDEIARTILNMEITPEGTLRKIRGIAPFIPSYGSGLPSHDLLHGIWTGQIGDREIYLLHDGATLKVFEGWNRGWSALIATGLMGVRHVQDFPNPKYPSFPTQFCQVPGGVVICPAEGRAWFYDGLEILPLGDDKAPGSPTPLGPSTGTSGSTNINALGYALDAVSSKYNALHPHFKYGRLGTVQSHLSYQAGELKQGAYRGRLRWIDRWGNLSPMSLDSEEVPFSQEEAVILGTSVVVQMVQKEIAWTHIEAGPVGTVGRILSRTKDLLNSGDAGYYDLPNYATGGLEAFATIPDNISRVYQDNVPDAWLTLPSVEVEPLKPFKLACFAYNCLWVGNFEFAKGKVMRSLQGHYGTIEKDSDFYPDPRGQITGMIYSQWGLLIFTETSIWQVTPNDSGDGYQKRPIADRIGCEAPSSIQILPNGAVVWLSREGFYKYNGQFELISEAHISIIKRANQSRLKESVSVVTPDTQEYLCWFPAEGQNQNNLAFVYGLDGGVRFQSQVLVRSATVTYSQPRRVLLAGYARKLGVPNVSGVWVYGAGIKAYDAEYMGGVIETGWIGIGDFNHRSPKHLRLWFRETQDTPLTIKVYKNYRKNPIEQMLTLTTIPADDPPLLWGTSTLDAVDTYWQLRKPYIAKLDLFVPDCEVFLIRIESNNTEDWEFIGMDFYEVPDTSGTARNDS